MTDVELKALITAVIAAGLLVADRYYVDGDPAYGKRSWGQRMDSLVENANAIADRVIAEVRP